MTYTIKILSHGQRIRARGTEVLADKILQAGIPLSLYCNKRGLCGKCFVEIVKGRRPLLGEKERFWLGQKNLGKNYRLACQYEINGDLEINVPALFISPEVPILPVIARSAVAPDPAVKKYYLELRRPDISSPHSLFEILLENLGYKHLKVPLDVLGELGRKLEVGKFKATVVVYREKEIIAVEPGNTTDQNFGLAVDIGTTTLVVDLVDLNTGRTLATRAALNSQVKRGADVISRISYASADPNNAAELRRLVLETLNEKTREILSRNRVSPASVYDIVVSGNTTMNHLLLGIPVDTLAVAPYHAVFSRLSPLSALQAGFAIYPRGKVYLAPNIRSFVGGDIASGLLASRLSSKRGNFLFIDLGTNGEIVLKAGSKLVATSTAAGPAFEGMNISCGMPALAGAIYKAEDNGAIKTFTLGNKPGRGVCGTGLIDLIAIFLGRGWISPRGAIQGEKKIIRVNEDIALTQEDVRQMQLACAAIKTGIRMMLKENHLCEDDLDGIYIAGAFGNYLNIRNSMKIGLLPRIDERKLVFIGNSSLAGAKLLLISAEEREKIESLIRKIRYVSLAADPEFQDYFIKALEFKTWP
jgi:uncharacterized 2Fe-2S/4Fe-4S cluster protein (DUF4445 family)